MQEFEEASMNFDTYTIQPFLERVALFISSGFAQNEIAKVVDLAIHMKVNEEQEVEFSIEYMGQKSILKIAIFKDDLTEAEIYFFASPNLAELLQTEIERYTEELEN